MAVMLDNASQMSFGDGEGLKQFFLVHRLAHSAVAAAIVAQGGQAVPGFDVGDDHARQEWELLMLRVEGTIDRPTRGLKDWLLLHSTLHQAEYDALGFGVAPNLIDVNFAQPDEFANWMFEHQNAHDTVGDALGIA